MKGKEKTEKELVQELSQKVMESEPMKRLIDAENFMMTTGRLGHYGGNKFLTDILREVFASHKKFILRKINSKQKK